MSYKIVRDYLVTRLGKKGFAEANELSFTNDIAMKDKFILRQPELFDEGPTLVDRLHPKRTIEIHLNLKLADNKSQNIDYQNIILRIEQLIKEIPNPSNFQASPFSIRNLIFVNLVETFEDKNTWILFVLTFRVEDDLSYA